MSMRMQGNSLINQRGPPWVGYLMLFNNFLFNFKKNSMKKIDKLKLNSLNKSKIEDRDMSRIYGGNYCVWGNENRDANSGSGKCSCSCSNGDYYSQGLRSNGDFFKHTSAWGYC